VYVDDFIDGMQFAIKKLGGISTETRVRDIVEMISYTPLIHKLDKVPE
jgi:hypothetical protein